MTLPVAPLALLFALIPTLLLCALAYWRFAILRSYSAVTVTAFAIGVALFAVSATVAASYSFQTLLPVRESGWVLVVPVLAYVATLVVVGKKGNVSAHGLALGGLVGLVPLCFLGFYALLLAACSYGDCL